MRFKVEDIILKTPINEATYQDAFNKIKQGDVIVVKTGGKVWRAEIIDRFGNQIRFNYDGQTYIITGNSFDGSTLTTDRVVYDKDGKEVRTTKGPTVKGVYSIIIMRNGNILTSVTPSKGRPDKQEKSQQAHHEKFEERKEDILKTLNELDAGDIMEITTGKLITKGKDSGSLAKNTITIIKLKVESVDENRIKTSPIDFSGSDASEYEQYHNSYFWFDSASIQTTPEGLILVAKVKNLDTKILNKVSIKNVFGIENGGKFKEEPQVTMNDIMKIPAMRNMMFKNPSLLDRILKRGPKGLIPLKQILSKYGYSTKPSKGKKVKFIFNGPDVRPDYRFNFKDGKTYQGAFSKDNVIKRTADNRRESMYLTLGSKLDDKTYEVKIDFVKLVNNEPQREEVGKGKIKIIEIY